MAQCTTKNIVQTAIHEESKLKARREKTFIISGLETQAGDTDMEAVSKLLRLELDTQPDINYCKRLGQRTEGRVQPLLVGLSKQEDAAWIIANARQLRNSGVRGIREQVYINANLTKQQARDAYEQRCKRRSTNRRSSDHTSGVDRQQSEHHHQPTRRQSDAAVGNSVRGPRVIVNSSRAGSRTADSNEATNHRTDEHHAVQRGDNDSAGRPLERRVSRDAPRPSTAPDRSPPIQLRYRSVSSSQTAPAVEAMEFNLDGPQPSPSSQTSAIAASATAAAYAAAAGVVGDGVTTARTSAVSHVDSLSASCGHPALHLKSAAESSGCAESPNIILPVEKIVDDRQSTAAGAFNLNPLSANFQPSTSGSCA